LRYRSEQTLCATKCGKTVTREGITPLKPQKRKDDVMNFLTIFIFCFLGAALGVGIYEITKINPVKRDKNDLETEVNADELEEETQNK